MFAHGAGGGAGHSPVAVGDPFDDFEGPGERCIQLGGLGARRFEETLTAREPVRPLAHRAVGAAQLVVFGVGVAIAEKDDNRGVENASEAFFIDRCSAEAVGKRRVEVGHCVPAGVGDEGGFGAGFAFEEKHAVGELGAGGMAVDEVGFGIEAELIANVVEEAFDDGIGPFGLGAELAACDGVSEVIGAGSGKFIAGEFGNEQEDIVLLDEIRPTVAVPLGVASGAVDDEPDGRGRVDGFRRVVKDAHFEAGVDLVGCVFEDAGAGAEVQFRGGEREESEEGKSESESESESA